MDDVRSTSEPMGWADAYTVHAARLTHLAVLLVGMADAHDLVADAVQRGVASRGWAQVEFQGAYLTQTLVNLASDRRRQSDRRTRRERRVALMSHRASAPAVDVERELMVGAALSALSGGQLAVVYLHYWEDLTLEQVAVQLGIGVGSVRTHLDRAKRRLRTVLPDNHGEFR